MDIERLITDIDSIGANKKLSAWVRSVSMDAATALSTLQIENQALRNAANGFKAENKKLRAELENEHAHRLHAEQHGDAFLEDCKRLNTELEQVKEKNAGLALALLTECAPNPDCLGDDEWKAIRAELEQAKEERDAAISDLETIMAYGGGNLDTCQYCKNGQCYARGGTKLCLPQWRGQKED